MWGKHKGYFDPVDANSIGQAFLPGALGHLNDGTTTVELDELCTSNLPPELLEAAEEILGFPDTVLAALDLCVYTSFDPAAWRGTAGLTYALDVTVNEVSMQASTSIVIPAVQVDSAWFQSPGTIDSLGVMYAQFTDPDTLGNAYRWFAKRINVRPDWDPLAGQVKDADFVAPLGSVTDDAFFNGLSFEFSAFRVVRQRAAQHGTTISGPAQRRDISRSGTRWWCECVRSMNTCFRRSAAMKT